MLSKSRLKACLKLSWLSHMSLIFEKYRFSCIKSSKQKIKKDKNFILNLHHLKKPFIKVFGILMLSVPLWSLAGGYDQTTTNLEPPPINSSPSIKCILEKFYIGVSGGYAWSDWEDVNFSSAYTDIFPTATTTSAQVGGDTWGLLAGYQINPHFALEFGGYDLFDGNRAIQTSDRSLPVQQEFDDDAASYIIYGALKGIVPLSHQFDLYAKIGPVYRSIDHTNSCTVIVNGGNSQNCPQDPPPLSNSSYWNVFVAAGAEFYLTQNVSFGTQWYYVPADNSDNDSDKAPAVNAIVGIISYNLQE